MIEVDRIAIDASLQRMRAFKADPQPEPALPPPPRDLPMMTCNGCGRRVIHRFTGYCPPCQGLAWLFKK